LKPKILVENETLKRIKFLPGFNLNNTHLLKNINIGNDKSVDINQLAKTLLYFDTDNKSNEEQENGLIIELKKNTLILIINYIQESKHEMLLILIDNVLKLINIIRNNSEDRHMDYNVINVFKILRNNFGNEKEK
jgi:hypothetical protein